MQKKDQVFLYIKDEIEKISSAEEKEILDEAKAIEDAVENVLNAGYRTKDIYNGVGEVVGTKEMGDLIAKQI